LSCPERRYKVGPVVGEGWREKGGGRGHGFEPSHLTFLTKTNKLTFVDKKKLSCPELVS